MALLHGFAIQTGEQLLSQTPWLEASSRVFFMADHLFSDTRVFEHHPWQVAGPRRPGNRKEAISSRGHRATPPGATASPGGFETGLRVDSTSCCLKLLSTCLILFCHLHSRSDQSNFLVFFIQVYSDDVRNAFDHFIKKTGVICFCKRTLRILWNKTDGKTSSRLEENVL